MATRRNYLGVRCVPFAASQDVLFSVSIGESWRSDYCYELPRCALNGHRSSKVGVNIRPITATHKHQFVVHDSFQSVKRGLPPV